MDETSPTARALLALEVLQSSPGITAGRLADKLGVSERAARRYVAILREAGIPVTSVRGPHGGFRLGRGLRLPPLMFSADEALGLVMAVLDGHHPAGDPTEPAGSALAKVVRALPEAVAAAAETIRLGAAPAPDRAAARPDPATTAALVQVCADRRATRFRYRSEGGTEWSPTVDPWAVVVRHGRWYLLCRSHSSDETRAYRVDRISAVEALAGTFTLPVLDDPVAVLEAHLASGWEHPCEVLVHRALPELQHWIPPTMGRLEAVDASTTRLTGSTSDVWWYAEGLARIPAAYEIVGDGDLRDAARTIGERLLAGAGVKDGRRARR